MQLLIMPFNFGQNSNLLVISNNLVERTFFGGGEERTWVMIIFDSPAE